MPNDPVANALPVIASALTKLAEQMEKAEKRYEEEKQEKARRKKIRAENPGLPESVIDDIWLGRTADIGRSQSLWGKMMASGVPDGRTALSTMGYARSYTGGRMGKIASNAMAFGEMARQMGSPYADPGADIYDASGKDIAYSSGRFDDLSKEDQQEMALWRLDSMTEKEKIELNDDQKAQIDIYREARGGPIPQAIKDYLGKGADVSRAVEEGVGGAAALSKVPRLASMLGGAGAAMQLGARFAAGPAYAAYQAAETVYKTADALYDPARSAAGLGYGFGGPLSDGFQTSLGRSINTKLDAFGSFGLSQQQTAAARSSIEGMGAGGPGSERTYDAYYKSMTGVMEDTQMSAQTLSPFYEQFMRGGGTEDEIGKLTKMLKDDLPKAAAASRMSLEGMATMIQKTTDAAAASPYNYRTKTEISQAVVSAQNAGAPPGFAAIAGGNNALAVAQTSSRLGIGYYEAMNEGGALQVTAARGVQDMLGKMTGDEFREYRIKNENGPLVAAASQMYNLSVDDIQRLYDQGIGDFEVAASLNDEFSDSKLGKEKTVKKTVVERTGRGGEEKIIDVGSSQKVIGKDLDLYKDKGQKVQDTYQTSIDAIKESFSDMGDQEALDKFKSDLEALKGQEGKKTWEVLQDASQKIGKDSALDQTNGRDGVISLSDDAKKYFKLDFGSETQNPNPRNAPYSSGGTTVN